MKNLIIIGIVGAVFFGASFIGSTMMLKKEEEDGEVETNPGELADIPPATTDTANGAEQGNNLSAPFKPQTLSEESVLKMAESIQHREAAIIEREKQLLRRESKYKFILSDIQKEKREYEAVVQKVEAKIQEAKQVLELVEKKKDEILSEQQNIQQLHDEIEKKSKPQSVAEANNIKKMADWIGSMPTADAALTFKRYADDGKLDLVARILRQIEARTAAKILSELKDPVLVTQLLDQFKKTIPVTPPKRR